MAGAPAKPSLLGPPRAVAVRCGVVQGSPTHDPQTTYPASASSDSVASAASLSYRAGTAQRYTLAAAFCAKGSRAPARVAASACELLTADALQKSACAGGSLGRSAFAGTSRLVALNFQLVYLFLTHDRRAAQACRVRPCPHRYRTPNRAASDKVPTAL